jgi:hypothetical protein
VDVLYLIPVDLLKNGTATLQEKYLQLGRKILFPNSPKSGNKDKRRPLSYRVISLTCTMNKLYMYSRLRFKRSQCDIRLIRSSLKVSSNNFPLLVWMGKFAVKKAIPVFLMTALFSWLLNRRAKWISKKS